MRGHHDWIYMWLYGRAKTPSDLPWYREEPQDLLAEIGKTRERPGRARSQAAGTEINFEKRDVLTPAQPTEPFDLVLDVGCLHSWKSADQRAAYRANLMSWLAPGGDYYLCHFERRHALDWRPIGPWRFPPAAIVELFSSLELREHRTEILKLPFPIGPTCRVGEYWFRRLLGRGATSSP